MSASSNSQNIKSLIESLRAKTPQQDSTSATNSVPTTGANNSNTKRNVTIVNSKVTPTLLFLGSEDERNYLPKLKSMVGTSTVYLWLKPVTTITEIALYCKSKGVTGVISTSTVLLSKLLAAAGNEKNNSSIENYAGSYFVSNDIEFVFINPLEQLFSISYMEFLTKRFISKLAEPDWWSKFPAPEFNWEILDGSNADRIFDLYQSAILISCDIETFKENLAIRCIGYTAVFIDSRGNFSAHSVVLPLDSMYAVSLMRKFNWELRAPKIFQNGKYDISYLSRYNAVPYAYLYDTANMFHSWYAELPKDLAFLGAFFVRKAMYWKDLAETNDLYEYYKYNALDTWTTALVAIAWILQAPEWAKRNYVQEFPVVFPCHMSEMTGMKRDMEVLARAAEETETLIASDNEKLSRMVGTYPQIFNTNSAPQNASLRKILGCSHIESGNEKSLVKMGELHPLNKRIVDKILDIRGNRKLASTYLTTGDKAKELHGRILYAINPHGTDTGRCASREHHFWCGLQIQNIPRDKSVKQTIVADEGFLLGECDLEQAESRDTAYLSGDTQLITNVESTRDFHSINASAFFGVSYEEIYDDAAGKTRDKKLRDLSKRTNHGANYLMGEAVLVDTMGDAKVWEAKRLLGLPAHYGLLDVASYLLEQFHKTYPSLRAVFYPGVVNDVMISKMLMSRTYHHDTYDQENECYIINEDMAAIKLEGWTRYCFGNPKKNKRDKNAVVAHVPQSLNAMTLNKAYLRVFYDIAIAEKYRNNFKLCAQIHDSILHQFREGYENLSELVRRRMEIPVTVRGYDNVIRTFTVPAAIKAGKDGRGAKYWNETE